MTLQVDRVTAEPVDSTPEQIMERIFNDWVPPWERVPTSPGAAGLAWDWRQLRVIAGVGTWDLVSFQAGKILEGALKSVLGPRPRSRSTFEKMLEDAQEILPHQGRSSASTVAGDTIRRIRNLTAHFNDLTGQTALTAAQVVAILVVFVEALQPADTGNARDRDEADGLTDINRDIAWMRGNWHLMHPTSLGRWLFAASAEDAATLLDEHGDAVLLRVLRSPASRFLGRLPKHFTGPGLAPYKQLLGRHIATNLVWILTCLSGSSAEIWRYFIGSLPSLGLPEHRRVLAALLPYDADWLLDQFASGASTYTTARNVRRMRTGQSKQWELLGHDNQRQRIAEGAWKGCDGSESFVKNRFLLALWSPPRLRRDMIMAAPRDILVAYVATCDQLPTVLQVARVVLFARPGDRALRDAVWAALVSNLTNADLDQVRGVPMALHRLRMTESFAAQETLRICLGKRASGEQERRRLARLALVAWQIAPPDLRPVVDCALKLVRTTVGDWAMWCALGVLDLCRRRPPRLDGAMVDASLRSLALPEEPTRDEVSFALLGVAAHRPQATGQLRLLAEAVQALPERPFELPRTARLEQAVAAVSARVLR